MVTTLLNTPAEILARVAAQAQAKRLALNFSQKTLSERAGVSLGVIKKFERTGKIALESLLKIALTLDALKDFEHLFAPTPLQEMASLDEILKQTPRRRGRK